MTDETGLPPEVTRLLHRALPSMVHVELLLLLARTAPQAWELGALSNEVKSGTALVAAAADDLRGPGLVEQVAHASPAQYRLGPVDAETRASIAALQDIYDRKPVTLVRVMYQRPTSPAEAFANAFRIRPS